MQALHSLTDEQLLERGLDDPQAIGVFYTRHVGAVIAFFRPRVNDAETALDLTAETFARALQGVARYQSSGAPGRAWLFAIARNLLTDSYRRGRVANDARRRLAMSRMTVDDHDLERIEEAATAASSGVSELVDSLPDDLREALNSRIVDETSYADLARSLGTSESLARKRVSRGIALLRSNFERRLAK